MQLLIGHRLLRNPSCVLNLWCDEHMFLQGGRTTAEGRFGRQRLRGFLQKHLLCGPDSRAGDPCGPGSSIQWPLSPSATSLAFWSGAGPGVSQMGRPEPRDVCPCGLLHMAGPQTSQPLSTRGHPRTGTSPAALRPHHAPVTAGESRPTGWCHLPRVPEQEQGSG